MSTSNNPLVSIIIISYNSSKYVLETLESAKKQTYKNIELIVSDDCSTDDTVFVCQKWFDENKERFVKTQLITVNVNGGITANCNRGVKASHGDWLKLIAGDDILIENCIDTYLEFVQSNNKIKAVYSQYLGFDKEFSLNNLSTPKYIGFKDFYSPKKTASQQFRKLLRRNFFAGPTFFVSKDLLSSIGGFDEKYGFEDLPIALKITKSGIKLYFIEEITVYYRNNIPSVTNAKSSHILFSNFYKTKYQFEKEYIFPHASLLLIFHKKYEYYRFFTMDKFGLNKRNLVCRIIFKLTYLANPFNFYNKYF